MKGTIKVGATVSHDFRVFSWPEELAGVVFDAEEASGGRLICRADGYGHLKSKGDPGEYGNGSIFLPNRMDFIKQSNPVTVTGEELKRLSKDLTLMGFDEGFETAVRMVEIAAEVCPSQREFLMELAGKMRSSPNDKSATDTKTL